MPVGERARSIDDRGAGSHAGMRMGHVVLIVVGALMALASSCVCGASHANGQGFFGDWRGIVLALVGLLIFGIGRFIGSMQKEVSK